MLVLERTQEVLEEELMEAINTRDWPRVSQGLQDFRAGGWSVPTALLAGITMFFSDGFQRSFMHQIQKFGNIC